MTLYSMTGFGTAAVRDEMVSVSVEIKSVNNRYFKLSLRVSDEFGSMEPNIEALLKSLVSRGSINATVRVRRERRTGECKLNIPVLQSYFEQLLDLGGELGLVGEKQHPRLDQLILLPGVVSNADLEPSGEEYERIWHYVEKAIREALNQLLSMRKTEGNSMARQLTESVRLLGNSLECIGRLAPNVAPQYRERLTERIGRVMSDMNLTLDHAVLVREIALFADRCDVSEEMVRLRSHLDQFETTLFEGGVCGKKLDFLTQELLRETNTIGSKANDAGITREVIDMKTEIERIREMVQNVE